MTLYYLKNVARESLLKDSDGSIRFYTKKKFARTIREKYKNKRGERIYDIHKVIMGDLDFILNINSEISN